MPPRDRVELRLDIEGDLHRRLKVLAANRDVTLKDLVIELLQKGVDGSPPVRYGAFLVT